MLNNTQIKGIFLECENTDFDGMYADDVDVYEYGRAIESAVREEATRQEREECVRLVKSISPEIARALEDQRKWADRSYPS